MEIENERTVRLSDGELTTVRQWGESGPVLVGVHGLGASRYGWARLGEHLAQRFRFIAYDQRGHGDSAGVRDMRFRRSVDDCAEVVASLGEPARAILGHSWGGAVAIAAGRRSEVERVVAIDPLLVASAGVWSESVLPEFRATLSKPREKREQDIRLDNAALPEIEIQAKLHAARTLAIEPIEALGSENGIDAGRWNFRALLDDYPRPLMLAVADLKRTVFGKHDRAYARTHGGEKVRLFEYEGASHSLQRDAFDRFVPDLEAFLSP